jgi:hypothetical protein
MNLSYSSWKLLFSSILLFSSLSAMAHPKCDFSLKCKTGKSQFNITFNSPSSDCTFDDTVVKMNDKKLLVPGDWYFDVQNVGPEKGICSYGPDNDYPIFALGNDQALMFLKSSGRPGFDVIAAVLLDLKQNAVMDYKKLDRSVRNSFGPVKTKIGFKLPLVKSHIKGMRCDCDAAYIEGWMEVTAEKGKLQTSWLKD